MAAGGADTDAGPDAMDNMERPVVDEQAALALAARLYGLRGGTARPMDGYDDKNFWLQNHEVTDNPFLTKVCEAGYTLKVTNSLDSRDLAFVEEQTALLAHLADHGVVCPRPVRNKAGHTYSIEKLRENGPGHAVRLLQFVPGEILGKVPWQPDFASQAGREIGRLHNLMDEVDLPAVKSRVTEWSLWEAPRVLTFAHYVEDAARRALVKETRVWKREIISRLLLGARPFSQAKPGKRLFSRLYLGKNHRFQPLAWEAVGKSRSLGKSRLPTASQARGWKRLESGNAKKYLGIPDFRFAVYMYSGNNVYLVKYAGNNVYLVLGKFQQETGAQMEYLREDSGLIHGDYNQFNIVVRREGSGSHSVAGVLDLGDCHSAPRLFEVALTGAYMALASGGAEAIAGVLAGYSQERSIPPVAVDLLRVCVCARLCQSLVMGLRAHALDPQNTYVLDSQRNGWLVLENLWKAKHGEFEKEWREKILDGKLN
ncbi:Hydroxylysine kinase [Frankliniella fusca]|uniref:Hydroxylysine kinase n=1 Tax=Frankliniella fusca TaxID=407009 RepID=A0AAE1LBF7_9NEOP|nr:Hydroxylysine kinase [Frankliniella fusca]